MEPRTHLDFWGHPVDRVITGKGALGRIGEVVEDLEKSRVLLLCGQTLKARTNLVSRLEDFLGSRLVSCYHDIPPHPSLASIKAASSHAGSSGCDVVVSIGGGSVMDTAKGVTLSLSTSQPLTDFRAGAARHSGPSSPLPVPFIAIPTTFAGAEFTDGFGMITEGGKVVIHRRRLAASTVILDPEVPATTPPEILRSSVLTSLSHCVEGLCSPVCTPVARLLLSEALGHLAEGICGLVQERNTTLGILGTLQAASHCAGLGMYNTHMGLSHALTQAVASRCHALYGVVHGILLPRVMDFNEPATGEIQGHLAALILSRYKNSETFLSGAAGLGGLLQEILKALEVPTRLRDVEFPRESLATAAAGARNSFFFRANPRAVRSEEEILEVLERAW